jgi:hypothetical protein
MGCGFAIFIGMENHKKELPGLVKVFLGICVVAGVILLFQYGMQAGRWLYTFIHR